MSSLRWYAVAVYSGFETKAAQSLRERIRNYRSPDMFGEIIVPAQSDLEDVGMQEAQGTPADRKFYPGFIFVQMTLDLTDKMAGQEIYNLITTTPRITGFVGGGRPTPLRGKGKFASLDDPI